MRKHDLVTGSQATNMIAAARRDLNLTLCRLLVVAKEKRDGRHPELTVLDLLIETLDALTYDDVVRPNEVRPVLPDTGRGSP